MSKYGPKVTVYDKMSAYFEGFLVGLSKSVEKER